MEVTEEVGVASVPVSEVLASPSFAATVVKIGTNADKMICKEINIANSFLFISLALLG